MNNEEKILAILETMQGNIAGLKQGQADTNARLDGMDKRLDRVEERLQSVQNSQMRVELEQFPKIAAALDGHKLNSELLVDIKKNLEEITPTVQALDILHQTGYAK